ncbi:uncharacterized protein LOC106164464 [Lingula anatina]|uniref:Uncharacterized protein LOC106164464 n=1 Tax=Lingula anatina TaxID=7574 RepID=A0A1S3IHX8_LINAN|nr:uncharacterized protein LOC106164464 [Lingula anatina]|eukprot:XP_013397845.1 uncharacterized protein LOC106164464 [Lingula anatina]
MPNYEYDDWRSEVMRELDEQGVSVLLNVLSAADSDIFRCQLHQWYKDLDVQGRKPCSKVGLAAHYRVGHLEASWNVRLKVKDVFAQVWGTRKLLSSFDAVSVCEPPELGYTEFYDPSFHWLHIDQSAERRGLHAYQGSVTLEDIAEDDWPFLVMPGSHVFHEEFYQTFPEAVEGSNHLTYHDLTDAQVDWYKKKGCELIRKPVPKGGMILWDSRTVHANARPKRGRKHHDRWRYVVFVCMTPAIWASDTDIADKKRAFNELKMTGHWPSQKIKVFDELDYSGIRVITDLPTVAKTDEVRRLAGDLGYDFSNDEPNGPSWRPKWGGDKN